MKNINEILDTFLKFVDKNTDWKKNSDTTNGQVIIEFINRNRELTDNYPKTELRRPLSEDKLLGIAANFVTAEADGSVEKKRLEDIFSALLYYNDYLMNNETI